MGVAQVESDAAVLALELLDRVEGRITAGEARDRRVQSAAGDEQQRETGTGLLEVDANGAFFVRAHGSSSSPQSAEQTGAVANAVAATPVASMVRLIGS